MNTFKQKINNLKFPVDAGRLALFFSILAMAYVASASNTKCLSASTCAVGSDPVFEQNVGIKGGTAFTATIDGSLLTNDRNIQLPDTSGTLAVTSTLAGNKMLRTNLTGEIEVDSTTYPVTLSPDLPLYTSATGEVTAGAFDVTSLSIGAGTSNQVLTVNTGGTALTFDSITGVPTLTANKPLISDGLGVLTTASLTADKIMITDTNGNLDTTNVYPLSFGANKPIVSDVAGNLTDITLNANEPVITDGNGNLATGLIDITTDVDTSGGTALQEIRVNAGATALEYFTPSSGGIGTIIGSGSADSGYYGSNICWGTGTMPHTTNPLDATKDYKLIATWDEQHYNQAIANGGANNLGFSPIFGDDANNVGKLCDSTTSGNSAYSSAGWAWNNFSIRQPGTCQGAYLLMEGTSSGDCFYQSGDSPNYWSDSACRILSGSMPSSVSTAYDYISFNQMIIDFTSMKSGVGFSAQMKANGGFNDSDTTNSHYKATWSSSGSCSNQDITNTASFESYSGLVMSMWNSSNQVFSDIKWVLIEYN